MDNKIIKVSPALKKWICGRANVNWSDIAVVLFEDDGILLYLKEYGKQIKIKKE